MIQSPASPDRVNCLGTNDPEEMFSLDWFSERDHPHPILLTVVPGLAPVEAIVSLSPGEKISPALKVVVSSARSSDWLNIELTKCLV